MLLIRDLNPNSDIGLAKLTLLFLILTFLILLDIYAFKCCINNWNDGLRVQRRLPYIIGLSYLCLELTILFVKKVKRKIVRKNKFN